MGVKYNTAIDLLVSGWLPPPQNYPQVEVYRQVEFWHWPPSGGMTTKFIHMAREYSRTGNRVAFMSFEDTEEALERRFGLLQANNRLVRLFLQGATLDISVAWDIILIDHAHAWHKSKDDVCNKMSDWVVAKDARVIAGWRAPRDTT